MSKAGFDQAMDRMIAGMQYAIDHYGPNVGPDWDSDEMARGGYHIHVECGKGGRKPTWSDLKSATVVLKDKIELFSASRRNYKDVQVHISRMGQDPNLPLAVLDVWQAAGQLCSKIPDLCEFPAEPKLEPQREHATA